MNEEMQRQLLARLDAIAAKLGVGADALWHVIIREVWIEGIEYVAWTIGLFIAAFVFVRYVRKSLEWAKDEEVCYFLVGLFALASAGCTLAACFFASDAIEHLLNPKFQALQYILSALK